MQIMLIRIFLFSIALFAFLRQFVPKQDNFVTFIFCLKIDALVKRRHSREGGNLKTWQLLKNTGFPPSRE